MQHDAVSVEMKAALSQYRVKLDPVALLHAIREAQSALAAVTFPEIRPTPSGESLEQFLAKLPDLWRQDAARTSRERRVQPPRTWRTRPDPFEGVWCDVLGCCRKTRMPVRWYCWADCKKLSQIVSVGSPAHVATQSAAVARHHEQRAGLRHGWRAMAGLPAMPELALVGADPKC